MSEHNGVRMACPDCTLSCVMHREDEMPPGIHKMVEGVPWCPNCQQPMKPAGSVEAKNGTPVTVPPAAVADEVPIEQRLEVIRLAQTEVDAAERAYARAKEKASEAHQEWKAKVLTLGSIIRRLTQVPAPLPLFDGNSEEVQHQPKTSMELTAAAEMVMLQHRLEELGFTVSSEQLDAMTFETYQDVTAFVQARENGNHVAVPACLHEPSDAAQEPADTPAEQPKSRRRGARAAEAHA